MTGRFFSTQTVVLELTLAVPHLPERGSDVPASASGSQVGGALAVGTAVARQGIETILLSPLGTGLNSVMARHALARESIKVISQEVAGDIGLRIVQLEPSGVRTTITSPGVETEFTLESLRQVDLREGDWVYISANELAFDPSAQVLTQWVQQLPPGVKLFVSAGGTVDMVPRERLELVFSRCDVLSMNRREAKVVVSYLGEGPTAEVLRRFLPAEAALVLRSGADGATIQECASVLPRGVPAYNAQVKDTTAVGDTHVGVLAASLMQGIPLEQATLRANAASALVLQQSGLQSIPKASEISDFMAMH